MTKYEARKKEELESIKEITISGITITITRYVNSLGIETSQTLTANQENQLKSALENRGFKIVWKDGVVIP